MEGGEQSQSNAALRLFQQHQTDQKNSMIYQKNQPKTKPPTAIKKSL